MIKLRNLIGELRKEEKETQYGLPGTKHMMLTIMEAVAENMDDSEDLIFLTDACSKIAALAQEELLERSRYDEKCLRERIRELSSES